MASRRLHVELDLEFKSTSRHNSRSSSRSGFPSNLFLPLLLTSNARRQTAEVHFGGRQCGMCWSAVLLVSEPWSAFEAPQLALGLHTLVTLEPL